jgi:hypothetical protein
VDYGRKLPIEVSESIRAESLHLDQRGGGVCDKRPNINTLTTWRKRRQIQRTARQHVHRPMVIPASKMVESDSNLQNALIEASHVTQFGFPQQFQRLVLLEVLTAVELGNPF